MDKERRVALVTGASRGIGAAVVRRLAKDGMAVAIHYFDHKEAAEELISEAQQYAQQMVAYWSDLQAPAKVTELVDRVIGDFGRIDVIVNNAAIMRTTEGDPTTVDDLAWDTVMGVNVRAPFLISTRAFANMKIRHWGRIINVSSVNWRVAHTRDCAYVTSKAALVGMTRALAREFGAHGVTVNAVAPGAILTESTAEADGFRSELDPRVAARWSIPRRGTVEEVANAVGYLATDGAAFVTGHVLAVDGGWL